MSACRDAPLQGSACTSPAPLPLKPPPPRSCLEPGTWMRGCSSTSACRDAPLQGSMLQSQRHMTLTLLHHDDSLHLVENIPNAELPVRFGHTYPIVSFSNTSSWRNACTSRCTSMLSPPSLFICFARENCSNWNKASSNSSSFSIIARSSSSTPPQPLFKNSTRIEPGARKANDSSNVAAFGC